MAFALTTTQSFLSLALGLLACYAFFLPTPPTTGTGCRVGFLLALPGPSQTILPHSSLKTTIGNLNTMATHPLSHGYQMLPFLKISAAGSLHHLDFTAVTKLGNLSNHRVCPKPWHPLFRWSHPNPLLDTHSRGQTLDLLNFNKCSSSKIFSSITLLSISSHPLIP